MRADKFGRGFAIACMLRDGVDVTTAVIRKKFDVSHATAKRDRAAALRLTKEHPPKTQSGSGVVAGRPEVRGFLWRDPAVRVFGRAAP
jgi:hypothetical protein